MILTLLGGKLCSAASLAQLPGTSFPFLVLLARGRGLEVVWDSEILPQYLTFPHPNTWEKSTILKWCCSLAERTGQLLSWIPPFHSTFHTDVSDSPFFCVWVQRKQLCSTIKQTPIGICFTNVHWLLHMKISLAPLQGDGSGSTRHAEDKQHRNRSNFCQTQGQAKASVSSRAKPTSCCLLQVTFSLTASAKIPEVRGKTDQSQSQNRAQELSLTEQIHHWDTTSLSPAWTLDSWR